MNYNYYNFLFLYSSYFPKEKQTRTQKKNICIHTSDNTRGVHNQRKNFKESKKKARLCLVRDRIKKNKRFYLYIPERDLDIDTHT
jgi:hypothetical protein